MPAPRQALPKWRTYQSSGRLICAATNKVEQAREATSQAGNGSARIGFRWNYRELG